MKTSRKAIFNMTSGCPQKGQYRTSGQKNISGTIGNKLVKFNDLLILFFSLLKSSITGKPICPFLRLEFFLIYHFPLKSE